MRAWSLWIFDRHCEAIFHADWTHGFGTGSTNNARVPGAPTRRRTGGTTMPSVTRSVVVSGADGLAAVASDGGLAGAAGPGGSKELPFDEEAKLVYGVVFSLRNMVRKLGGKDETFQSYTTSTYTLSHLHTPTQYTFVLLTDPLPSHLPPSANPSASSGGAGGGYSTASASYDQPSSASLRNVLRQIYTGPFLEFVVRNPIGSMEGEGKKREEGVDSDMFREGVEATLAHNKLQAPNLAQGPV